MQSTLLTQPNSNPNNPNIPTQSQAQISQSQYNVPTKPKRHEWSLLYTHQAKQYNQEKIQQKRSNDEKIQKYRHDIQAQLSSRNNLSLRQKQEDKKYREYIEKKKEEDDLIERNNRMKRQLQIRKIGQQNYWKAQQHKKSRIIQHPNPSSDPNSIGVSLLVGQKYKQPSQIKIQQYNKQKQLIDILDKQLLWKQQEKNYNKQADRNIYERNQKYMRDYYQRREAGIRDKYNKYSDVNSSFSYSNNNQYNDDSNSPKSKKQQIYRYYEKLNRQKEQKQRQLQNKLIYQQMVRKQQQQMRKQKEKRQKKSYLQSELKKVLAKQIEDKNIQSMKSRNYNPEQHNNIFGGNKPRSNSNLSMSMNGNEKYNKKQYYNYLLKQAQQQNIRKKQKQYMNQQQYRLNMNQLNKVVTGTYQHQRYIDRTINTIGSSGAAINRKINDNNLGAPNTSRTKSSLSLEYNNKKFDKDADLLAVNYKLQEIRKKKQQYPMKYSNSELFK